MIYLSNLILQLLLFILFLLCILLLLFSLYILYLRRIKYGHLPGPKVSSFFKGNFPDIRKALSKGCSSFEFILDCHIKYGDIVVIWLFFLPWVNVADPYTIKAILLVQKFPKDPRFYRECLETLFGERAMGRSLLTNLNDEQWQHRRSLMNPAFHRLYLRNLMCHFNSSTDIFLAKLRNVAENGMYVKMADEFSLVTLDVICKAGFGIDLDVIIDPQSPFIQSYNMILKGVEEAFVNPLHKWDFTSYPRQREVIKALRFLRNTGRDTIRRRTHTLSNDSKKFQDILDHILSDGRDPRLSEEDLIDDFVTFFSSGHETTSSTLSFCLLELLHNNDVFCNAVQEIKNVLGAQNDVTYDDLPKFKYLDYCLKETLRLYPPAPGIIRVTPNNVKLNKYVIPKGTTISSSPYVMGRHPQHWANPEGFQPERWRCTNDEGQVSTGVYFPFSLGPRNCIGQQFAMIESKVILAKFLNTFNVELCRGQTKRIHERVTDLTKE
ncbi:cholesterol 24-hydroxylase-like isoform X2 [Xenia sp. Carnegie-2017]|uniref:cholesterol 24-hydroxylase-like isoform X2 n=1 Tax=Xenia sp. Carnegie-2017 TaxID=2897299 RepID=UPI001F045802|nr:cholesterol 24-hydroxylase-like isoform X2 [Xenia sp. Carnegie-2017]